MSLQVPPLTLATFSLQSPFTFDDVQRRLSEIQDGSSVGELEIEVYLNRLTFFGILSRQGRAYRFAL